MVAGGCRIAAVEMEAGGCGDDRRPWPSVSIFDAIIQYLKAMNQTLHQVMLSLRRPNQHDNNLHLH